MILGIISDTHDIETNVITHIIKELKERKVERIIHCGDIISEHLKPELFGNIPVICALTEEQTGMEFQCAPNGWIFTRPGNRVKNLSKHTKIYVGHKRFFELLRNTGSDFRETLERISLDHDCVRWLFAGHTHRQVFNQNNLINCINPGAIQDSFWGHEFAIVDTKTNTTTFSRILPKKPVAEAFRIAVISDSKNISDLDPDFWEKLAKILKEQQVKKIIHCGNLATKDIGRKELEEFTIYYNLRENQRNPKRVAKNWKHIKAKRPIVSINGYRFYVQHDLGKDLLYQSEIQMLETSLKLVAKYPEIEFVLFGLTHEAFLEENEQVQMLNPGDVVKDQSFAIIELPRNEITFSRIQPEPLST